MLVALESVMGEREVGAGVASARAKKTAIHVMADLSAGGLEPGLKQREWVCTTTKKGRGGGLGPGSS
jgi:hypothetical protein